MPHLIASGKRGGGILRATTICWLLCLGVLAGCKEDDAVPVPLTRVKVVTTEVVDFAPPITLTGVIAAKVRTDLSFRLSGKINERLVTRYRFNSVADAGEPGFAEVPAGS